MRRVWTRRGAGLMSSAVMVREVRKAVMLSPRVIPVDEDEDEEEGSWGNRMPVRGIFHSPSLVIDPSVFVPPATAAYASSPSPSSSPADLAPTPRSVLSSPTPVAITGLEPETRPIHNRHTALTTSNTTTTRHRTFSPARFASISSSNCVYCIVLKSAVQLA